MKTCRQITTFAVNGKAVQEEKTLAVTREEDEAKHLESQVIDLYPQVEYQTIEGFGGAMTQTSAYLFSKMDVTTRRKALETYFGTDGNQYHFIRTSMDSCDFSLEEYQAVSDPVADPDLATFSIEQDKKYVIPMLKEVMQIQKENKTGPLSVLLSPWSPPYQWKTPPEKPKNDAAVYGGAGQENVDYEHPSRNNGGSLKPQYYASWAKYLAKYVKTYLAEGIPVTMMTMQNESIAATNWDSCVWTAGEQKTFLKENLYPEFKKEGLLDQVGIFIWDHNKERVFEWASDMIDEETASMISGIAFHWYSGDHFEAVQMTHEQFPDKTLMLSECCGLHRPGQAGLSDLIDFLPKTKTPMHAEEDDARDYAHDIIGNLNAGMNRWIDWNLCVDEMGGPRHVEGGFTAPMIVKNGTFRTDMTYDYIGHFSKYIVPGAVRIGASRPDAKVEITAAKNQDGSIVLVVLNKGWQDAFYAIRMNGDIIRFAAPSGTISTLVI